jgi:cyclophilin family peptidyl-prolyl cis-trans isomerase
MKRIAIAISIVATLAISCGQEAEKKTTKKAENKTKVETTKKTADNKETTTIKMEMNADNMEMKKIEQPEFDIVTTHGTMRVRLYNKTPQHRDNFVKLVSEKFYDGIRFHRVIEGFMIQTGDPYSRDTSLINKWGTGGPDPDYTVPAEFVSDYHHKKGALAAARKGDLANPRKASSGSQFYIVHDPENCAHLDGQYSIFGEVISGLDIIDKIATLATDHYDRPYEDVIINTIKPVIELAPVKETPAQTDSTKTE